MIAVQITDLGTADEVALERRLAVLAEGVGGGAGQAVVLLRDPTLTGRARLSLARRLRARTSDLGARLWVADRLDVAVLVAADGVHLGGRSVSITDARRLMGTARTVSVACHTPAEVVAARDGGADACLLSPIFASPGKGSPLGLEALRAARRGLGGDQTFALIALGGIDAGRIAACREAGADGAAAIRGDVLGALVAPRSDG